MKAVALLVWFDERPELLRETVASWSRLCSGVVAVDGAFEGFPGGSPHSPVEQAEAIRSTAAANGMDCIVHVPTRLWSGQPEKRSIAWRLGEGLTEPTDWFIVIDADEMIVNEGWDTLAALDASGRDVGLVSVEIDVGPTRQRRLMRAVRGVRVEGLHYYYVTPDGRVLWNYPDRPEEPAAETDVRLWHRRDERGAERIERQQVYYRQRYEPIPSEQGEGSL